LSRQKRIEILKIFAFKQNRLRLCTLLSRLFFSFNRSQGDNFFYYNNRTILSTPSDFPLTHLQKTEVTAQFIFPTYASSFVTSVLSFFPFSFPICRLGTHFNAKLRFAKISSYGMMINHDHARIPLSLLPAYPPGRPGRRPGDEPGHAPHLPGLRLRLARPRHPAHLTHAKPQTHRRLDPT
jgi:hypothetical protein